MKELNIFFDKEYSNLYNYNNLQTIDYDEFVAIEHILERHEKEFSSDIDIYKLFNDIKTKLTPETQKQKLVVNDVYDIPYQNIGNGIHILRVVTLPNSKDILTMFPLYDDEEIEEISIDEGKTRSRIR